jgi:hypothetical protein
MARSGPPPGAPLPYPDRVAAALPEYRRLTGRDPDPDRFDVGRPEVLAAYRRFAARPFAVDLGAHEGEWIALRAGLKPMLREVLDGSDLAASLARWRAEGLDAAVVDVPVARSGAGHLARSGGQRVAFVGRDGAALREAADLEAAELRGDRSIELGRFKREQGAQLGYPPCCVEAFAALGNLRENRPAVAAAAARSASFEPPLSNTVLSVYHHVSWYPCRYDCPPSLALAQAVDAALGAARAEAADAARRLLAMPRLYLSDRLQLLLAGAWRGATFEVQGVHTPRAFDRRDDAVLQEWMFAADVGADVEAAGGLARDAAGFGRIVWLPVGAGS